MVLSFGQVIRGVFVYTSASPVRGVNSSCEMVEYSSVDMVKRQQYGMVLSLEHPVCTVHTYRVTSDNVYRDRTGTVFDTVRWRIYKASSRYQMREG